MIQWKEFDGRTAPDEISEDEWLILVNDRVVHATHNATERYFYRVVDDGDIVYVYRTISHYAPINLPLKE